MNDMKTALLLIAHGSRNPAANAELDVIAQELRRRGHGVVEPAFLELAEPGIVQGAERCVAQHVDRVVLLPYFLSAGVHVRRDLQTYRQQLAERFPHVQFAVADPLGPHTLLVDVLEERVRTVAT